MQNQTIMKHLIQNSKLAKAMSTINTINKWNPWDSGIKINIIIIQYKKVKTLPQLHTNLAFSLDITIQDF